MDFPIVLDAKLAKPLHDQLTGAIKSAISSKRLTPRQAMPSTRELAQSLGVSRDTVMRSYEDLAGLGFLRITVRSGTFVSDKPPSTAGGTKSPGKAMELDVAQLSDYARRLLDIPPSCSSAADLTDINCFASPTAIMPVKTWRKLLSAHCDSDAPEQLEFLCDDLGYRPLREEMSRYLNHTRGLHSHSDQIAVFSNSQLPLHMICRLLINPGDLVVVEEPCHTGAKEIFQSFGARLAYVPIDEDGAVVSKLSSIEEHCKLIYVSPSHQDPTGVTMTLERRKALLAWANKHCDFVVEDGFDSDYFYKSPTLPALAGLDTSDKVLYIYSFWKLMFPLVTVSSIVLPERLINALTRVKASVDREFSTIVQYALTEFLSEGHLEKYAHKTRTTFQQRRQAMMFALKQKFRKGFEFFGDGGGLHLTVRVDWPLSEDEVLHCAKVAKLPMVSTNGYYALKGPESEYLISFAMVPEKQAMPIVENFASAIGKLLDTSAPATRK